MPGHTSNGRELDRAHSLTNWRLVVNIPLVDSSPIAVHSSGMGAIRRPRRIYDIERTPTSDDYGQFNG